MHASSLRLVREVCKPDTCLRTRAEGWAHKYRSPKTYFESSPALSTRLRQPSRPSRFRQPSIKMTRASTSAANFGLLLVALVLMLHSVVGELIPTQVRHHLSPREYRIDNCVNKLTPENEKYKLRCGPGSDPKHTCFFHWAGDLTSAQACPRLEPFGNPDKILVRDDSMKSKLFHLQP